MKYGYRTPSFKKSFSARTKGRMTRSMKSAFNPYYGKKGMGWVNNPKKAAYNSIYHRTTRSVMGASSRRRKSSSDDKMATVAAIPTSFILASWLVGWLNGWVALVLMIVVPTIICIKMSKSEKEKQSRINSINASYMKVRNEYINEGKHVYSPNTRKKVNLFIDQNGNYRCPICGVNIITDLHFKRCPVCNVIFNRR